MKINIFDLKAVDRHNTFCLLCDFLENMNRSDLIDYFPDDEFIYMDKSLYNLLMKNSDELYQKIEIKEQSSVSDD